MSKTENGCSEWLVEIRLKDWIYVPEGTSRTVAYEEVIALDNYYARHIAFDQFEVRCRHEPILRRKMAQLKITPKDCCAPDAVALT